MAAIVTRQLSKDYETKDSFLRAVNKLDLTIEESSIFSLLGPNGAGKTSTVRLLTGLLRPSEGTAKVLGLDIKEDAQKIRGKVGLLTETPSVYDRLTVRENLEFIANLYSVPKGEIKSRIEEIIDLFEITEKIDDPAGSLSKGMRQKVAIARAMFHDPEIIFLDEPTASLAPESAKVVREQILKLAQSEHRTFFICTHNLFEAERLSTRVGIINKGHLIAQGTPVELRNLKKEETITVVKLSKLDNSVRRIFEDLNWKIHEFNQDKNVISASVENIEEQTPQLAKSLVEKNYQIIEIKHEFPTLERIYLELVETERIETEGVVR